MKKILVLSISAALCFSGASFAQTQVSEKTQNPTKTKNAPARATVSAPAPAPDFVAKTPLYVVPQSTSTAQRIHLAPLAKPQQDFRVAATPLHRGTIRNPKREGELLDTMMVNMSKDFSQPLPEYSSSLSLSSSPPSTKPSSRSNIPATGQNKDKNPFWENYHGAEMPVTEVGRVWSLFGDSVKALQDQTQGMRIVFFDTEDPVVRQFASQGLLKQSENNFVHQTHGLAAFLIKNSKINNVAQNACFIVYDKRFGGHLWRNFIAPFDKEGVPQAGTDFLVAHELGHCLDIQEKDEALVKGVQDLSKLASLGIAPSAWQRVASNKPLTRDAFFANIMPLSQDTAYQQYQERVADAFAYLWSARNLPASFDLKGVLNKTRGVQSPWSSHATSPVFEGLSFAGKPVLATMWQVARKQQVKVGTDPSVVSGPYAGNVTDVAEKNKALRAQEAQENKENKENKEIKVAQNIKSKTTDNVTDGNVTDIAVKPNSVSPSVSAVVSTVKVAEKKENTSTSTLLLASRSATSPQTSVTMGDMKNASTVKEKEKEKEKEKTSSIALEASVKNPLSVQKIQKETGQKQPSKGKILQPSQMPSSQKPKPVSSVASGSSSSREEVRSSSTQATAPVKNAKTNATPKVILKPIPNVIPEALKKITP